MHARISRTKALVIGLTLSLTTSLIALAFPLASTALAVACMPADVTSIVGISEDDPVAPDEPSTLVVEARNAAGEPCSGVVLDYGDDGDADANRDTSSLQQTTADNGRASFTRPGRPEGLYRTRVWVDLDNDNIFDGATETDAGGRYSVTAASPTILDVRPEEATGALGSTATLNAIVRDQFGDPGVALKVDFEITAGPNQNLTPMTSDLTCVDPAETDAVGECTATYADAAMQDGTDTVCAWIDSDNDDGYDPAGGPEDGGDCDAEPVTGADTSNSTDKVIRHWGTGGAPDIASGPCAGLDYGESQPQASGGSIIAGSPNDDTIPGTGGSDTICPLGGDDTVDAGAGNDRVVASKGADDIAGRSGEDRLEGGGGKDALNGGLGADALEGGEGNDVTGGGDGKDNVTGGGGIDTLRGKGGADKLTGGDGPDILKGGTGNDSLEGGGGGDQIDGGSGSDSCRGGPGRDEVVRCER